MFALDKTITGDSSLLFEKENFSDKEDFFIIGKSVLDQSKDFLNIIKLCGTKLEINIPNNFLKMVSQLTVHEFDLWQKVMPKSIYENYCNEIFEKAKKALEKTDFNYYENIFLKSFKLLNSLQKIKVNKKKWEFLNNNEIVGINRDIIDSLKPDENGFCEQIIYDQFSTTTGRLTVKSGPQILRLNKEYKSVFKSRHKGGKIVQFDYVSLEPRIALILAGHNPGVDIYSDINKMVFDEKFERDICKLSTLSVMYGMSAKNLAEKTNLSISDCQNIILPKLKEYFGVHSRNIKLMKEMKNNGFIRNHFGRAIYPNDSSAHILYSCFNQSSAFDAGMLGFLNVVEILPSDVLPIFIIHDNLGLDIPKNYFDNNELFEKIKEAINPISNFPGKLIVAYDNI